MRLTHTKVTNLYESGNSGYNGFRGLQFKSHISCSETQFYSYLFLFPFSVFSLEFLSSRRIECTLYLHLFYT